MSLTEKLIALKDEYSACTKCPKLCESRNKIVFGIGNPQADIMVIAEAPGVEEDSVGISLIGQSGKILDMYLCEALGLNHLTADFSLKGGFKKAYSWPSHEVAKQELCKTVFYTQAVLCKTDKRDPSLEELNNCRNRLLETIYLVDPVVILGIDKLVINSLFGKRGTSIIKTRGTIMEVEIPGKLTNIKYPVIPLLNPQTLMRSGHDTDENGYWSLTRKDIQKAVDLVKEYKRMVV